MVRSLARVKLVDGLFGRRSASRWAALDAGRDTNREVATLWTRDNLTRPHVRRRDPGCEGAAMKGDTPAASMIQNAATGPVR